MQQGRALMCSEKRAGHQLESAGCFVVPEPVVPCDSAADLSLTGWPLGLYLGQLRITPLPFSDTCHPVAARHMTVTAIDRSQLPLSAG